MITALLTGVGIIAGGAFAFNQTAEAVARLTSTGAVKKAVDSALTVVAAVKKASESVSETASKVKTVIADQKAAHSEAQAQDIVQSLSKLPADTQQLVLEEMQKQQQSTSTTEDAAAPGA